MLRSDFLYSKQKVGQSVSQLVTMHKKEILVFWDGFGPMKLSWANEHLCHMI